MNKHPFSLEDFDISVLFRILDLPKDFIKNQLFSALMIHELRYKKQSFIRGKGTFGVAYVRHKTIDIYKNPLTATQSLMALARKITKPFQAEDVFCEICILRLVYDIDGKKSEDFNQTFGRYPRAAVSGLVLSVDIQKQIKEQLDSAELWIIRTLANEVKSVTTLKMMYDVFVKKNYDKTGDYVLLNDHYDAPAWMKTRITKAYTDALAAHTKAVIVKFLRDELNESKTNLSLEGKIALLSCAEKYALKEKRILVPVHAVTHVPED